MNPKAYGFIVGAVINQRARASMPPAPLGLVPRLGGVLLNVAVYADVGVRPGTASPVL